MHAIFREDKLPIADLMEPHEAHEGAVLLSNIFFKKKHTYFGELVRNIAPHTLVCQSFFVLRRILSEPLDGSLRERF